MASTAAASIASSVSSVAKKTSTTKDEFAVSDSESDDGLLPTDISPIHYALHLQPNYEKWTFAARVVILIRIDSETDLIQVNAANLQIESVSVVTQSDGTLEPTRIQVDEEEEVTTFRFDAPIRVGEATLTIIYSGTINEKLNGFYKTQYMHQGQQQTILVTQFESCDARRCLPCWDEPNRKATFAVTLVIPAKFTALSNMPIAATKLSTTTEGWTEVSFQTTPIMSSYLLAFAIGEFESIQTTTKKGVVVRLLTPLGKIDQGQFSLEFGRKCLEFYSDYFSLDYPLPKLDLLAIPDIAIVAMENWGLITFGETVLLVHPTDTSLAGKTYVALIVAHEISHQWFGNIVTMDWWTDLWLNEGFASWMEHHAVATLCPEWRMWHQYLRTRYTYSLRFDSVVNSHPVEVPVESPDDIDEIFDGITYSKGSVVIRMLHAYLGDEQFKKGVSTYLKKYQYSNAVTMNLWEQLSESSGRNVTDMMSGWSLQTGFPLITVKSVKVDAVSGQLTLGLTQRRFLLTGPQENEQTKWSVPISVVTPGATPTQPQLLSEQADNVNFTLTAPGSSPAFKLNAGQVYLYRVLYPLSHYVTLRASLSSFLPEDRLGLENDLFALVRAGLVPFSVLGEFLEWFSLNENDPTVWSDICTGLTELGHVLQHAEATYTKYCSWIASICAPVLARVGWDAKPDEDHLTGLIRGRIITMLVNHDHQPTIREACQRFYAFISSEGKPSTETDSSSSAPSTSLPSDVREGVYSAVVAHGDLFGYEMLLSRFRQLSQSNGVREELVRCLHALGSSPNKALLSEALQFALYDPLVRVEDCTGLLIAIGQNPAGLHLFWEFAKKNWTQIVTKFEGAFCLANIVDVTTCFAGESQAAEVKAFFKNHRAPTAERAIKQSIERIHSNAKYLTREEKNISKYLTTRLSQIKIAAATAASSSTSTSTTASK